MSKLTIGIDLAYAKPIWVASIASNVDEKLFHTNSVPPRASLMETADAIVKAVGCHYGAALTEGVTAESENFTVAVEAPFVKLNKQVAIKMSVLVGMIQALVTKMYPNCHFFTIEPSKWQAFLLRPKRGADRKKLSIKVVRKHYGKRCQNSDEADAINIARFAWKLAEMGDDRASPVGGESKRVEVLRNRRSRTERT